MRNFKLRHARVAALMLVAMMLMVFLTACGESANDTKKTSSSYNVKVTEATDDFYVNDFAELLSAEQKSQMMEKAIKLDEEYSGIQVVVTIVDSLDSVVQDSKNTPEIEEISYAMYSQYGIGADDMGILVLFSVGDREVRIETGYEMQTYITDVKSGQLLDEVMDYFRNDQFAEGLVVLQDAIISEIESVVPIDWASSNVTVEEATYTESSNSEEIISSSVVDSTSEQEKETPVMWIVYAIMGAVLLAFVTNGICYIVLSKKYREKQAELEESYESKENTLRNEIQELTSEVSTLKNKFETEKKNLANVYGAEYRKLENRNTELSNKISEIQRLHPDEDFDAEIEKMYRVSAQKLDEKIQSLVPDYIPNKDKVNSIASAIFLYNHADREYKGYMTTDIEALKNLYQESKRLLEEFEAAEKAKVDKKVAEETCKAIKEEFSDAIRDDLNALNRVYAYYENLTDQQKSFFPDKEMLSLLKKYRDEAWQNAEDKKAAEEAERKMESILNRISSPDEDDCDALEKALSYYAALTLAQRAYFNPAIESRARKLHNEAFEDHERRESARRAERERREAERRREEERRRSSSSSHSSFGGSSHYSGHGGLPSGGGASRKF